MGCASSTEDAADRANRQKPSAQGTGTESDLPPVARPLRDIRRDVEKDPNAMSQAPMPDAHVGLIDDGKTREIDHWLDSMGFEAPPGEADPDYDINRDDHTPSLSAAALRRHETSTSLEVSNSGGRHRNPLIADDDPVSDDGQALKDAPEAGQQRKSNSNNPLALGPPVHNTMGPAVAADDSHNASSVGPGGKSALLPVGPSAEL
jgi:hypothetical protein